MSRENVKLLQSAYDAFNRRDPSAFLALCDPDVEYFTLLMQVEGGDPYHGHEGVRRWWARLLAISPDFTVDVDDVRGTGDLTIAKVRTHGHGVGSDAPMEQIFWQAAEWRAQRISGRVMSVVKSTPSKPPGFRSRRCRGDGGVVPATRLG